MALLSSIIESLFYGFVRTMAKRKKKEQTWWKKLCWRLFGVGLMVWAISLIISCLGYHAYDPSFSNATTKSAANWLGFYGAKNADVILTWWGVALPLFLIAPVIWGYGFLRLREMVCFYLGQFFFCHVFGFGYSPYQWF